MIVIAGFGERRSFVGSCSRAWVSFLDQVWAKTLIVLITSTWFGLAHYSVRESAALNRR